ncbi:MAG: hypothetical protein K1X72_19470 [Pyrinomonadaceae bacterium]|nr:hypothetical protein [Pyrinomonadaceae bacterium]
MKLPKAKTENIVTQKSGKELLLYDLSTNKAYCLNETAAIIYQFCDGKKFSVELKIQTNFPDEMIFLALEELNRENLLEENYNAPFEGMSRRQAVKKIGFSSLLALPLITSIIAPAAAASGSTCLFPGGLLEGEFLSPASVSGACGSYPDSLYESVCDTQAWNCCTGQTHYVRCTEIPTRPGFQPISSLTCYCEP